MLLDISPVWSMIVLDLIMIVYTLWVLTHARSLGQKGATVAVAMASWLLLLHLGISNEALFNKEISSMAFLFVIFGGVGAVGVLLLAVRSVRDLVMSLDQSQLMLMQGIRVFFGAGFLMQASTGDLPQVFGVIDGFTHIGAGFFGLVAAYAMAAGIQGRRRVWFANIFGLADILVVASSLALILLPEIGPHHPMMYAVFLPAPLWLWFHLISIQKLLGEEKRATHLV